ncbi:hypothetical protein XELAEV_18020931mg [Xenopus laevis]|uniref:Uncharacterized protein n=1 Tax=Xenopus laevis TaxID=8355 RepID=A0A974D7V4_XENLA|nr:hypothetical protein XELAEV_18020931mg [Xenopus laevis]
MVTITLSKNSAFYISLSSMIHAWHTTHYLYADKAQVQHCAEHYYILYLFDERGSEQGSCVCRAPLQNPPPLSI